MNNIGLCQTLLDCFTRPAHLSAGQGHVNRCLAVVSDGAGLDEQTDR